MSFFWSDEDKNRVAVLLRQGLPASKIATQLACSRNAVIGVVSRDPMLKSIGLSGRANRPQAEARPRTKQRVSPNIMLRGNKPPRRQPRTHGMPDPIAPTPLNLTLTDLASDQCKWPVNDPPKGEPFAFCGHVRFGAAYCKYHDGRGVRHDH